MIHLSKLPSRNVRAFTVLFNKVLIDFCTFILNVKDNNVGRREKWEGGREASQFICHACVSVQLGRVALLSNYTQFGGQFTEDRKGECQQLRKLGKDNPGWTESRIVYAPANLTNLVIRINGKNYAILPNALITIANI